MCLLAVIEDAQYRDLITRKQNQIGLLELMLVDDSSNEPVKMQIWGQLAQDRFKYTLHAGSVIAVINASLSRDASGQQLVSGEVLAYSPIGMDALEWMVSGAAYELPQGASRAIALIAWAAAVPALRAARQRALLSVRRRCLRDVSLSRRQGLHSLALTLLRLLGGAEVEAVDADGAAVRISIACPLLAEAVQRMRMPVAAEVRGAGVLGAYGGTVRRLVLRPYSQLTIAQQHTPEEVLHDDEEVQEEVGELLYCSWAELVGDLRSGSLGLGLGPNARDARRLVHCSLAEVVFAGAQAAELLVADRPSASALQLAYRSARLVWAAPSTPLPIEEVAAALLRCEEVQGSADEEVAAALMSYCQRCRTPEEVQEEEEEEEELGEGLRIVSCADPPAVQHLLGGVPAELLAMAAAGVRQGHGHGHGAVDHKATVLRAVEALRASTGCDLLVVLRFSALGCEEDGLTAEVRASLEEIVC